MSAPQNLYACRSGEQGKESWLALAVTNDAQWKGLKALLGHPAWSEDAELETHAGRRRKHEVIDEALSRWAADHELDAAVETLVSQGIPAAAVWDARIQSRHPQFMARGFYEPLDHPVVGTHGYARPPFRFATIERWNRTPCPTMGQHNHEILRELGLTADEISALEHDEIIGTRPKGL